MGKLPDKPFFELETSDFLPLIREKEFHMGYIDLHTHSTASDGTDSPERLMEKAENSGLEAIALTDHDILDGLPRAEEAARDLGLLFIRGCEISTTTEQGEVHVLGLWIPHKSEPLESFLKHLRSMRSSRNAAMVEKLRNLGMDITMEELAAEAKGSIGRPHMAKIMLAKGYVSDRDEAFGKYLGINGKAYVPKIAPRPEQAVRILVSLGATAAIAHPLLRPRPDGWLDSLTCELAGAGLGALEAWHSSQSSKQAHEICELAKKYKLGVCGGSDYHGKSKPGLELGMAGENVKVPFSVLENLVEMRKNAGLPS